MKRTYFLHHALNMAFRLAFPCVGGVKIASNARLQVWQHLIDRAVKNVLVQKDTLYDFETPWYGSVTHSHVTFNCCFGA